MDCTHAQVHCSIINDTNRQWKPPIKYRAESNLYVSYIKGAISEIEKRTCITFQEDAKLNYNQRGIIFKWGNDKTNCKSKRIGREEQDNVANIIYLYWPCQYVLPFIQSLIFETLGVYPQQTRSDRDGYVNIKFNNIKPEYKEVYFEFNPPTNTSNYDTHYDYGSITQYWPKSYSKNNDYTIEAKGDHSVRYQRMMGQKVVVTSSDYRLLYRQFCNDTCKAETSADCQNNGYPNPKKCEECICPYPYTGRVCTEIMKGDASYCPHRRVIVQTTFVNASIYGWKTCYILIEAQNNMKVQLVIREQYMTKFDVCTRDYSMVEVKYKADKGVMGLCFCGYTNKEESIISESNSTVLIYHGYYRGDYVKFAYKAVPSPVRISNSN
uniref:Metalloendopeptidase n=1 Tax=Parastrongyloides trichosuri TaxID=131310 RepID=A0A0N5A4N2_PARTI